MSDTEIPPLDEKPTLVDGDDQAVAASTLLVQDAVVKGFIGDLLLEIELAAAAHASKKDSQD